MSFFKNWQLTQLIRVKSDWIAVTRPPLRVWLIRKRHGKSSRSREGENPASE